MNWTRIVYMYNDTNQLRQMNFKDYYNSIENYMNNK